MNERQWVCWTEDGGERTALWRSESGAKPPRHVRAADDRMTADAAYKLACEGTALLWRGDFHGARQLLSALRRRVDRKPPKTRRRVRPRTSICTGRPRSPARAGARHAAGPARLRCEGWLRRPAAPRPRRAGGVRRRRTGRRRRTAEHQPRLAARAARRDRRARVAAEGRARPGARRATGSIRPTASSHRCAASTSTSWPTHRTARGETGVRHRHRHGRARRGARPPRRGPCRGHGPAIRVRWRAPARTSNDWAVPGR